MRLRGASRMGKRPQMRRPHILRVAPDRPGIVIGAARLPFCSPRRKLFIGQRREFKRRGVGLEQPGRAGADKGARHIRLSQHPLQRPFGERAEFRQLAGHLVEEREVRRRRRHASARVGSLQRLRFLPRCDNRRASAARRQVDLVAMPDPEGDRHQRVDVHERGRKIDEFGRGTWTPG